MPYQGEWYIPCRVINARLWGKAAVEDFDKHTALCVELLSQAQIQAPSASVHMLLDVEEAESLPPLYLMFARAMPVLRFKNRGVMFVITRNRTIKSIIELTAHVMNFSILMFNSRSEAMSALEATLLKEDLQTNK
ncbi:MAG: hypothetical protein HY862_10580 [Chloroflexi bacterium]|nr:hypothetical protein [Chloroflexota bacterium]